ncbi:hypothetical protein BC832DRAFT_319207 [Gaertneriomyces semiglobifer]|nr:hypothetical protein BC832DRAFT_319207 [Gaertneriomyces semiglobifer]
MSASPVLSIDATLPSGDTSIRIKHIPSPTPSHISQIRSILAHVIEEGRTYPHENITGDQGDWFFVNDVFIAVPQRPQEELGTQRSQEEDEVWGAFYIKPNFPGRSSHICNAGFITHPEHRNTGIGTAMGQAFLTFAPQLGYRASLFNLVFESNIASVRIWRNLGFKEVGRVPKAGRLRKRQTDENDGQGGREHEWADAIMFYYDFTT